MVGLIQGLFCIIQIKYVLCCIIPRQCSYPIYIAAVPSYSMEKLFEPDHDIKPVNHSLGFRFKLIRQGKLPNFILKYFSSCIIFLSSINSV